MKILVYWVYLVTAFIRFGASEEALKTWEKQEIVDIHNRFRAIVRATNMIQMVSSQLI